MITHLLETMVSKEPVSYFYGSGVMFQNFSIPRHCSISATIKRDMFGLPMLTMANFLPSDIDGIHSQLLAETRLISSEVAATTTTTTTNTVINTTANTNAFTTYKDNDDSNVDLVAKQQNETVSTKSGRLPNSNANSPNGSSPLTKQTQIFNL